MEKLDFIIEKLNEIIPGGFFGLISISIGILGDIIALLMFPPLQYDFLRNPVSALCLGPGGIYFNIGNILSGVFALGFVNSLGRSFNEEQVNIKLKKSAVICANISCLSFIVLGIFCGSNLIIAYIHGIAAITSWGFGFFYFTLYNLLIIQDSNFSKSLGYIGFITSFSLGLLIILFFLHLLPILRPIMFVLPLMEWINTFLVIFWYIIISSYMIFKRI
jgi:hypothetical protein